MSIAFHPQTQCQREVVHGSLGDVLCFLIKKSTGQEIVLPRVEFAYNNYANRSTRFSAFQICTACEAPMIIDLALLLPMFMARASDIVFSQHINKVHEQVQQLLDDIYAFAKAQVDPSRTKQKYEVGDWVFDYMRRRLQPKNYRFDIQAIFRLEKSLLIMYISLHFPPKCRMSSPFNITILLLYNGQSTPPFWFHEQALPKHNLLIPQTITLFRQFNLQEDLYRGS